MSRDGSLRTAPAAALTACAACLFCLLLLALPAASPAALPAAPDYSAMITGGTVNATAASPDGSVYIGGSFTAVGPNLGGFVGLDTSGVVTGTPLRVNGSVSVVAPDGSGGFYVGGSFTYVGETACADLAHIRSDGSLDTGWLPNPSGTVGSVDQVTTVAVSGDGKTVYVGGNFITITGPAGTSVTRNHLAAVNADPSSPGTYGRATAWDPNADAYVTSLILSGTTVYVGGAFTAVNDTTPATTRSRLAAFSTDSTGIATTWNPSANLVVRALAISENGSTIYAGGGFTTVNTNVGSGTTRSRLAAFDATGTGSVTPWNPSANAMVWSLAVRGATVYAGGQFTSVNIAPSAVARNRLAAFDATTGTAATWNPDCGAGNVNALAVSEDGATVFAGGAFTTVNTAPSAVARNRLAAFDSTTGAATAWNPNASNTVNALAVSTSGAITTVYAGGTFTTMAATSRNRIAHIKTDGTLDTAWNPNVNSTVYALAVSGDGTTVYAGGMFTTVNGTTACNRLAAFDVTTGTVVATWNPNVNSTVRALAVSGDTVYAGGAFTAVNGTSPATTRNCLAAFDASAGATGTATPWNPNASGTVYALAVSGDTVYAGGDFTTVNGTTPRNRLAAFSAAGTGAVDTLWSPDASGIVNTLAVSGSTVYAGGDFTGITGPGGTAVTRNRLAAIDADPLSGTFGRATDWDPNVTGGTVSALAVRGTTVYAGGAFTTVGAGATPRIRIAAFDASTGVATDWNPGASGAVNALAPARGALYVGGSFTLVGSGEPAGAVGPACPYFAAFRDPGPYVLTWTGLGADAKWSNPEDWDVHATPQAGDSLAFPAGALRRDTCTNDISGLSLADVAIDGGYTIGGNAVTLTGALSATLGSGGTASWGLTTALGTGSHTVTVSSGTLTMSGAITGSGVLTKNGSGTLVLSAAGAFTGSLAAAAGSLQANASGSPVTVAAGATLTGTGPYGAVDVHGMLSPGSSPGTLVSGTQTWEQGGAYAAEYASATGDAGTAWDLIDITGDLTVNATSLSLFTITVSGTLAGLDNTAKNYRWQIVKWSGSLSPGFDVRDFTLINDIVADFGSGQLGLEASAGGKGIDLVFYGPTAATVSDFGAQLRGGAVSLSWRSTAANLLGFRLCLQSADGRLTRVGPALIPARFTAAGAAATYRVRDAKAQPGQKLTYVLLALGFDGSRTRCGPFTVRAGGHAAAPAHAAPAASAAGSPAPAGRSR